MGREEGERAGMRYVSDSVRVDRKIGETYLVNGKKIGGEIACST